MAGSGAVGLTGIRRQLNRLAFWWLRRTYTNGVVAMRTASEQEMVRDYDSIAGEDR